MKDKRRYRRYDVSHFPELKAGTQNGPIGERLMTISEGGCGFWAPQEDFRLRVGERVDVHLFVKDLSHDTRCFKGEILYILPHPMEAQIGRFYGVRFREEDVEAVREVVLHLEDLLQQGKIKISL